MRLPTNVIELLVVAGIIIGAIQCFFGYRIFKLILGLTGFLLVGTVAGAGAYSNWPEPAVALLFGLIGGVVGAGLFVAFYFVGIFCFGAVLGAILVAAFIGDAPGKPELVALLIAALVGGVVGLILQKAMIIVSTAFNGSAGVVAGIMHFAAGAVQAADFEKLLRSDGPYRLVIIFGWLLLGTLGAIYQYRSAPEPKKSSDG